MTDLIRSDLVTPVVGGRSVSPPVVRSSVRQAGRQSCQRPYSLICPVLRPWRGARVRARLIRRRARGGATGACLFFCGSRACGGGPCALRGPVQLPPPNRLLPPLAGAFAHCNVLQMRSAWGLWGRACLWGRDGRSRQASQRVQPCAAATKAGSAPGSCTHPEGMAVQPTAGRVGRRGGFNEAMHDRQVARPGAAGEAPLQRPLCSPAAALPACPFFGLLMVVIGASAA